MNMTMFNRLYICLSSLLGGGFGVVSTLERILDSISTIVMGIIISVVSFIILHYLGEWLGWGKRKYKNYKKR